MKLNDLDVSNAVAVRSNKTVYCDKKQNLAIKVFDESFSKVGILNEALNQSKIEETGINCPRLEAVTQVDGKWAIVTEYIKGKTLAKLMEENPGRRGEYLDLFVDIQLSIHAEKCPLLTQLKDKMNAKISQTTLDATTRYELHTRLESMPTHNKICHGDFNPSNVIISEDGTPYVIDWSHVTKGNAGADAARTYLLFCLSGDRAIADEYLKLFCKKSDTAMQYVQKWMPIVAASQSVKGKAEEREILLSWVDVVDYE
ncbi:MAG: phosphotransferase [Oscillospiraceae bacterium]|nr:phosphotransferase [Oscillospiraceae bacterium]